MTLQKNLKPTVEKLISTSKRLLTTNADPTERYSVRRTTQKLIEDVGKNEGFIDGKIVCYGQVGKGQGVTGDLVFVNIYGQNNRLDLFVKQGTTVKKIRDYFPVNTFYHNESQFYTKVYPEFQKQQQRRLGTLMFDNVPACYGSDVTPGQECVILDNVISKGFTNIDKKEYFTKDLFQIILTKYGQLHGLSNVLKTSDPRKFAELSQTFIPYWEGARDIVPLNVSITDVFNKCLIYLKKANDQSLLNKMQQYAQNGLDTFIKSNDYKGTNGVFLHGDSWSNNMMFKFNESQAVEDMKFIDFQTCKLGSAVYDLSYCIYSGGSKEIFDNLDYYLELYHHNLAETCSKMGCNKFMSIEDLKQEWKDYCKFGWVMAMVILRAKLVRDDAKLDLLLMLNELEKRGSKAHLEDSDEEEVEKRTLALLEHMNKRGFL